MDPIIELEHEIRVSQSKSYTTIVVFFYLKAAYDTVDHTYLLHTLAECGIKGTLLSWIEDFLTERSICVSVEDAISEILKIYRGVPQGSCISSLLFIFLLSTLPKSTIKPVGSNLKLKH